MLPTLLHTRAHQSQLSTLVCFNLLYSLAAYSASALAVAAAAALSTAAASFLASAAALFAAVLMAFCSLSAAFAAWCTNAQYIKKPSGKKKAYQIDQITVVAGRSQACRHKKKRLRKGGGRGARMKHNSHLFDCIPIVDWVGSHSSVVPTVYDTRVASNESTGALKLRCTVPNKLCNKSIDSLKRCSLASKRSVLPQKNRQEKRGSELSPK